MNFYAQIIELQNENKSYTLATVVDTSGSVPGKVGFKMIITEDKKQYGTIGGGALELTVFKEALKRIEENKNGIESYKLTDKPDKNEQDEGIKVAMSCEGRVSIFYEVHLQKPVIYLFGGGHVGKALLYMLAPLKYHTCLVDNRPEIANKHAHPHASEIIQSDYVEYARTFSPAKNSLIVILTQGHRYDTDILKTIYERDLEVKYIGIIASKAKAFTMIKELKTEFGENVDTSRLSTPIGLKIGGNTAEEIALAIAAELQSIRYNKVLIPE